MELYNYKLGHHLPPPHPVFPVVGGRIGRCLRRISEPIHRLMGGLGCEYEMPVHYREKCNALTAFPDSQCAGGAAPVDVDLV